MAIPNKAFRTTNDELATALAEHCEPIRTADGAPMPGFAGAGGFGEDEAKVARPGTRPAEGGEQQTDLDDDEEMTPIPADPDPTIVVDPSKPIPRPDRAENIPLSVPGVGGPKLSEAEFRALIQQHLAAILSAGRDRTQAADVHRMRPETGYSRESVRQELVRLCNGPHGELDRFRLRRDDADRLGVYEIYAAEPAYAA